VNSDWLHSITVHIHWQHYSQLPKRKRQFVNPTFGFWFLHITAKCNTFILAAFRMNKLTVHRSGSKQSGQGREAAVYKLLWQCTRHKPASWWTSSISAAVFKNPLFIAPHSSPLVKASQAIPDLMWTSTVCCCRHNRHHHESSPYADTLFIQHPF